MIESSLYSGDPIRGLTHLLNPGADRFFLTHEEASKRAVYHQAHPFGLDTPAPLVNHDRREFVFTGGGYDQRDNTITESFLANVRYWAGFESGSVIEGLRVITTPFDDGDRSRHYVFFEMWIGNSHFISGETTDFPEGTREDMVRMEDVFALLSRTYQVEIRRVTAAAVPLAELYQEKIAA